MNHNIFFTYVTEYLFNSKLELPSLPYRENYLLSLTRWQFSLSGEVSNLELQFISTEQGIDLPPIGIVEDEDPVRDIDDALDDVADSFIDIVLEVTACKPLLIFS